MSARVRDVMTTHVVAVRTNASFKESHLRRPPPQAGNGRPGDAVRRLGFALADRLSQLGVGISSFASVGNKYDISSNDMLMWWEQDGATRLAVLYLESFGNPRKFARTARRVTCGTLILAARRTSPTVKGNAAIRSAFAAEVAA